MADNALDRTAKHLIQSLQDYALLSGRALGNLFRRPLYLADIFTQADSIGVGSIPIVLLTGFFTGGVLALQSSSSLAQFGAAAITGQLVSFSMIKELGPVLTSLMVSGRNASGMASELGSMVVTEQIDAMRALGTDPLKKLVMPRIVATVIMLFFLTILSDTVGTMGFIIATVGCFYGMSTKGGTQGVGRATTQAVVVSSVLIIASDFVLSRLMIGIFGR